METAEFHVVPGRLFVPYHNWYGLLASRFFCELRDNKRLLGTICPSCRKVYMPPRSICPRCFEPMDEWVELPSVGTVQTYTIVRYTYSREHQPREAPYILAIIKLDGADTGMCHLIGEVKPDEVFVGMRVQAVFRDKGEGGILDISHFKPV